MSGLKRRVDRLEGGKRNIPIVIASVPSHWSKERQEAEVTALAIAKGAVKPFNFWIIKEQGAEKAHVGYIGDFRKVLDYIKKHGSRIGDQNGQRERGYE